MCNVCVFNQSTVSSEKCSVCRFEKNYRKCKMQISGCTCTRCAKFLQGDDTSDCSFCLHQKFLLANCLCLIWEYMPQYSRYTVLYCTAASIRNLEYHWTNSLRCAWVFTALNSQSRQSRNVINMDISWMM
jgi:hypothetical protein